MNKQPVVYKLFFKDLHELESAYYKWDLVFKKISTGNFHGSLNIIDMGVVQLIDGRLSGTLYQRGFTPEDHITFAIPAIDTERFWWHYRNVSNATLLLFPANHLLNAISYDGFHVYTLSIQKHFLEHLISKFDLFSIREQFTGDEKIMFMRKQDIFSLNSLLQALFLKVQMSQDLSFPRSFINNVQYRIPEMVLKVVHQNLDDLSVPVKRERDKAISKAIDFILGQDLINLSIQEISSKTGIKQRSLEYAFKEYFHVGPKNFIKALRLNNFRQSLMQDGSSVSESAFGHGFNHLGQLSRDYKLLFGELPSDTMKWVKAKNTS